jgi:hypothetical protein
LTATHVRAQITDVRVSGPNFSGTRVWTPIKYKSTAVVLISLFISSFLVNPYGGISTIQCGKAPEPIRFKIHRRLTPVDI